MLNTAVKQMTWTEFSSAYCERQEQTPDGLLDILQAQVTRYKPDGWMLLECQMMDSNWIGQYTILPYGPRNTFKDIPSHPVSPRGIASDASTVSGVLVASELPQTEDAIERARR